VARAASNNRVHEQDDRRLVGRARRGSEDAVRSLFQRHWERAWSAAFALTGSRTLADEVAQDAFERAFASLGRFKGESAFSTWLFRIVVNRALDVARREHRTAPTDPGTLALEHRQPEPDPDLEAAVARLRPDRRTVVVLRYWLDLTPPEIAAVLALPVGTVHSRLARALADLRSHLEVEDARPA
jgi:RNA polymerase sigma-70 factor, ECF subfamily